MKRSGILLTAFAVFTAVSIYSGFSVFPQSRNSRAILTIPPPAPDHRIQYGSEPLQFGELRLPAGRGPHPVAVIIHGGCWMSEYGLAYMGHMAAALAREGVATWSLEYRRVGDAGGGWPGTFRDVAAGTDYLRVLAGKYPLDLGRVIVAGHSAGGHLALLLAARRDLPGQASDPLKLSAVVPMAAITDLRRTGTACDSSVSMLMRGSAAERAEQYDIASPINRLPIRTSQLIIHGEDDRIVPPGMVRDYAEAARKRGDDPGVILIPKAGHFEIVDPESSAWPVVRNEILKLLK